jgi:simple sugar transport system ATP-binding protein
MREIIRAENVTKRFEKFVALDSVSFSAHEKEIIGLVGDNGAGKTTLINILVGLFPPDEGRIFLDGKEVRFSSPRDARARGIEIVYQFGNLVEGLSIYKNFFLGRELLKRAGFLQVLDRKRMRQISEDILNEIGINQDSKKNIESLSGGQMQAVALGRAFHFGTKMLLLDEPTRNLSLKEVDRSLKRIATIRDKTSMCLIFVTHNVRHVFHIADRIVVLDRGRKSFDKPTRDTSIEEVAQMIAKETVHLH